MAIERKEAIIDCCMDEIHNIKTDNSRISALTGLAIVPKFFMTIGISICRKTRYFHSTAYLSNGQGPVLRQLCTVH